jgi:hypothetical protein
VSVTFAGALLAQVVMVALLRVHLGRGWLRHPGTLVALAAVVNAGIGPLLLRIPSVGQWDTFGLGIAQNWKDDAALRESMAMLAFTLAYLAVNPQRARAVAAPDAAVKTVRVLDWRPLALAVIPLALLTAHAKGYNSGTPSGAGTSVASDLTATFFLIVIVCAAVAFLLRYGTRWFLPVFFLQSVLLAIAGERTPVIMDGVALVLMLGFVGVRVPRRQLAAAVLVTAVAALAITGLHAQRGRDVFYTNTGIGTRLSVIAQGLRAEPATPGGGPGLLAQASVRLAGVDFAGGILQAESMGYPSLSPGYIPESLLLAVPSFAWPAKLSHGLALSPQYQQIDSFGLQQVNFITGLPGGIAGYVPWFAVMLLCAALGYAWGKGERWLLREITPARMVMLGGAAVAALWYEAGLSTMLVQFRAAVALALAVRVAGVFLQRRVSRGPGEWQAVRYPAGLRELTGN